MINDLLSTAKKLFISECVLSAKGYHNSYQQQMEALYINYFCKDFEVTARIYTPEHDHIALFQDLNSPSYRASITQPLPQAISRLLQASRDYLHNKESSHSLLLSSQIKHEALNIANMPPFSQTTLFEKFNDIKSHMGHAEFLAIICTAFLKQHCLNNNSSMLEKQLFEDGLRNAYICLCLTQNNNQDGVSAFISGFMHFISLIYLHRELMAHEIVPCKSILLEQITSFLPKFNYWLAKDWGLPENILDALRERFIDNKELTGLSAIMQTADHSNLALMLFQEKLITAKQIRHFIHVMELSDFNLIEQLFSIKH